MSFASNPFVHPALDGADGEGRSERTNDGWAFTRVTSRERPDAERFIRTGFIRAYGAKVSHFFPLLMSLRRHGELVAACGLRHAHVEPLFLETYFDAAIEAVLSAAAGEHVTRTAVIEVGNLAVARAGIARQLIVRLTSHLHEKEAAWVVFSAVPSLRNNFVRLGIPLLHLAPADRNRLAPGAQKEWGTYYDAEPQVTAVRVAAAHAALVRTACIR